ncbi:peptidyl-prolyl cis-trans isomerase [Lutimaribacter marinistellae]|uniref:peptidylprolyl isomerase n=1 Tax=Lutimaribacter marinistellae TaxID=1820329 RepID=A0ABV7TMK1_9RHOB
MISFLREPLLHFFVLGALIFGLFAVFDDTPPQVASNAIIVNENDAQRLIDEFEGVWRRPPSEQELEALIDQFVREEVYVREAEALGLDQNDAVIRGRLQTKMEFLTESGAEAVQPDDATLQEHLEENSDKFTLPGLIAFEQVLLAETADDDAIRTARDELSKGIFPERYTRASLLPTSIRLSPRRVVDGTFGTGFFETLEGYPVGDWAGPLESSYGMHLVRVKDRREGRLPELADIRGRVEQDWRVAFTEELRLERYRALLTRYEVERPNAAEVLGQ